MRENQAKHKPPAHRAPPRILSEKKLLTLEATDQLRITEATAGGLADITATLARGDIINRNARLYSSTVLEAAATEARDRVTNGEMIGLMDHPGWTDSAKGKPERIVIKWNRLYMNGPDLKGEGVILDTALGRDLMALRAGGVHLALSTNGYARTTFAPAKTLPAKWTGKPDDLIEVIEDFELLTADVVTDPANTFARIEREAVARRESFRAATKKKTASPSGKAASPKAPPFDPLRSFRIDPDPEVKATGTPAPGFDPMRSFRADQD